MKIFERLQKIRNSIKQIHWKKCFHTFFFQIVPGVMFILLFLLGMLYVRVAVQDNLAKNSFYYVQHMPRGEGVYPEPIILLRYLDDIPKIPESEKIYHYKLRGNNTLLSYDGTLQVSEPTVLYDNRPGEQRMYFLSVKNGKLNPNVYRYNSFTKNYRMDMKNITNEKETIKIFYDFIQSLLDYQKEPDINLQWLFNLKYEKQFDGTGSMY